MEIFLLRPYVGQSVLIDLKRISHHERKALDLFSGGPIEILFCRATNDEIVLSVKAPIELDIFVSGNDYT